MKETTNNQLILNSFGKGRADLESVKEKGAVIYTRVSSKRQEDNLSLDVQLQGVTNFAIKNNYHILASFGGCYESAKSDERKEFQKLLRYVKNSRNKVKYILVYSFDRFSRTGGNAIYLSDQLRKKGIEIISVTQPTETVENPSGELHQNIMMVFSHFDNELRKQKAVAGMTERLNRGYWVCKAPIGYQYNRNIKEKPLEFSDKAELVKRAFELKVYEGYLNTEIIKRLAPQGLKLQPKTLSCIFTNPIYAGYISHKLLKGNVVNGTHPPLVSEELFLKASGIRREVEYKCKETEINPHVPLRNFIICNHCRENRLAGYKVNSRGIWYYKCSKKGCKNNRNANVMHEKFMELLEGFTISPVLIPILKTKLEQMFVRMTSNKSDESKRIKIGITELKKKISTLEERFAFGEISEPIHNRVSAKLNEELKELNAQLLKVPKVTASNIQKDLNNALKISSNLKEMWHLADARIKRKIQKTIFPDGIFYDRLNDQYRTFLINDFVAVINKLSENCEDSKKGIHSQIDCEFPFVGPPGLEPGTN